MMKNLLLEGRYDKVTTQLSREIVEAAKQGQRRLQTRITLFKRTVIDVNVYFHYLTNVDTGDVLWVPEDLEQVYGATYLNPKEIRKEYKNKRIILHVDIPRNEERRKLGMSNLIPELKNIIRHEIEHITQHKFKDREREGFFSNKRRYPQDIEYWEYLVEPYEVEAYVRGLYKKAKTLKQPLNVVLNTWWDYLDSIELHPDEIQTIKTAWIDYAKKHLPQTPLRTYGYQEEETPIEGIVETQRVMGFKLKGAGPNVNCIIRFDAPDSGNLRFKILDALEYMDVNFNSVTGGGGTHNSYKLDLNLYDEKEAQAIIDDLSIKLMLKGDRIKDATYSIREPKPVVTESIDGDLLFEAKKDTLKSKYTTIPDNIFSKIVDGDPSTTKKYSDWMLREMLKDESFEENTADFIINTVIKFDQSVSRINHDFIRKGIDAFESQIGMDIPTNDIDVIFRSPKDINSYNGIGILNAILDQVQSKKTKREEKYIGSEKLYEDDNFLVILPKTKEGSCHYGAGTQWCTAAREGNQFENYSQRGTLYYIIFKAKNVLDAERISKDVWKKRLPKFEKIARFIPNGLKYEAHGELYDAQDQRVNEDNVLNGLFGVTWRNGTFGPITQVPNGTKPFYDSFNKLWTVIDTHYAKNGLNKPNTGGDDDDWGEDWEDDEEMNDFDDTMGPNSG